MAVYFVSTATGKIQLKSVRDIQWDFLMDDFNGAEPKPKDLRAHVQDSN